MNAFTAMISGIFLWFSLPALCCAQGTMKITFDGPPIQPTNSGKLIQSYSEAGFDFTPLPGSDGFIRQNNSGGGAPGYPNDGSTYLQAGYGEGLDFSGGNLFGLASVDLAGYSYLIPNFSVDFIGYESDGSTIMTSFSGTGLNFQTYYFPSDWSSGLTKVEIPNAPWSLDDLVATVPEPTDGALFSVGVTIFLAHQFKNRRRL